jgi:hypothetical protein
MGLRRCLQTLATAQQHKASLVTSQATAALRQRMMTTTTAMNPFASATEQLSPAVSKFVHVLEEYRKEKYVMLLKYLVLCLLWRR